MIKFGTDGWRAVIADEFTFENVRKVTQATCDFLLRSSKARMILIGYDNRFFSQRFANTAASVVRGNGFKSIISNESISSPVLSKAVHDRKAAIGIMITASHNPYLFNGFKLKGVHGGSVSQEVTNGIEDRLNVTKPKEDDTNIRTENFIGDYQRFLKKLVDPAKLKKLKGKVIFDAMSGPGGKIFDDLVGNKLDILFLRKENDPFFGGTSPEPIETNLAKLIETVKSKKALLGIAVDGDADRIGLIDDTGRYLPPQTVMPLLLLHLIKNRKLKGKVVQTVSMGYLPAAIAKKYKLFFEEVPVGYKHIGIQIEKEKVLLGGEESGGYGVGLWCPERDGLLNALLVLEMLAAEKKPLSQIVNEMYAEFGHSSFKRVDFPLNDPIDSKDEWTSRILLDLQNGMDGFSIREIKSIDGVKIIMNDDAWVLMRPSGTEPLVRTYSEAKTDETVSKLLEQAKRLVNLKPLVSSKSKDKKNKLKAKLKK